MLINLSNHPFQKWTSEQIDEARKLYGSDIIDIAFPSIPPEYSTEQVHSLVFQYYNQIFNISKNHIDVNFPFAVHLQGEFTFVYHLVSMLKQNGIECVASTSQRMVEEGHGQKIVKFNFVQFRKY